MNNKKNNIILDLDETLISSQVLEEFNPDDYDEIQHMTFHNMEDYYVVFERPHVQEFLDYLFENFNVSVWTAATKDYALFVVSNVILVKPERKLDLLLFSYHCRWSEKNNNGHKGLKTIWDDIKIPGYDETNTYIIDDLPEVNEIQPGNSIRIEPFDISKKDSEHDDELLKVADKLKEINK